MELTSLNPLPVLPMMGTPPCFVSFCLSGWWIDIPDYKTRRLRCSHHNSIHARQHSVIVGAGQWYAGGLVTLARQHRPHLSAGVGGHQSLLSNCSRQPFLHSEHWPDQLCLVYVWHQHDEWVSDTLSHHALVHGPWKPNAWNNLCLWCILPLQICLVRTTCFDIGTIYWMAQSLGEVPNCFG